MDYVMFAELDLALKDINFKAQPREKIGIVGRTGAGKSSLMLALFRLIEPCNGEIVIDGVDVTKIRKNCFFPSQNVTLL